MFSRRGTHLALAASMLLGNYAMMAAEADAIESLATPPPDESRKEKERRGARQPKQHTHAREIARKARQSARRAIRTAGEGE